ncbi:MAG: GNAT family N-acetyltransferase [Clostridiales bacterium]|nr:GNAT family N-acetyltransferase [Clostridiales bacterium]
MRYRNAIKDDIPQLVDMRISYLKEDFNGLNKTEIPQLSERLSIYFGKHLGRDLRVYVCEANNYIIATVFLIVSEKPANPSFINGKLGHIMNVYTRPPYRRQGIAGELVKIAISEAKRLNLSFIDLEATKDGYKLYSHFGFEDRNSKYLPMRLDLNK